MFKIVLYHTVYSLPVKQFDSPIMMTIHLIDNYDWLMYYLTAAVGSSSANMRKNNVLDIIIIKI